MDKGRISKIKPVVLTKDRAIHALIELRDYLVNEASFSANDVELCDAITDIDTSIAILKTSSVTRVSVYCLNFSIRNQTTTGRVYLPEHHGIWKKFVTKC